MKKQSMKWGRSGLLLTIVLIALSGCVKVPPGITPVAGFEGERYLGTWYEIARMDNRFERGLFNVTANYGDIGDGTISVENRGYKLSDEAWKSASGKAKFVESADVGYLKVAFFGPFYASYVVYDLDDDYQYAFVTGMNKDFLWLLARQPTISDELLSRFKTEATDLGFDMDKMVFDVQRESLPR